MRFGYAICTQNYWDWKRFNLGVDKPFDYPDHQLMSEALELAVLADDLGFDTLWSAEHHFSPYLMTPSPIQLLSYLAGRTKNADVGSAVIVLPWHDPVRLTEEIAMMDIMLGDRMFFLGFGRGASADEFAGLRIPMSESRARFAECWRSSAGASVRSVFPSKANTIKSQRSRFGPGLDGIPPSECRVHG
jgi:hypothetical protein